MGQVSGFIDLGENIVCHQIPIGEGVSGFVYRSRHNRYHIFISDTLSEEAVAEVLAHEVYHIKNDLPKLHYIIGLDMQHEEFEKRADIFARAFNAI